LLKNHQALADRNCQPRFEKSFDHIATLWKLLAAIII